jgi:hypothetical protein
VAVGLAAAASVGASAQGRDTVVAWRVAAQPIFKVGGADALDTASQFNQVMGAVRLSDGRVVVLEADAARYFDAKGAFLHAGSRRGRGPGETQYATSIVRLPGDTVVVEQRGRPLKRVYIGSNGRFAREDVLDEATYRAMRRWAECLDIMLPDLSRVGCVRIDTSAAGRAAARSPGPGLLHTWTRYIRVPRSLDSAYALGRDMGFEQYGVDVGGQTRFLMHPFHTRSFIAAGGTPMRIAIATNPEYEIEIWRPDGVLDRTLRRANARRAPSAKENAAAAAATSVSPRLGPQRPGAVQADRAELIKQVPVPTLLAAVTDLAVASTGEVLVGREGHLPGQPTTIIDIFNRAGNYIGILRLPPRFKILDVGTDYVLGRRLDENDAAVIEVYRLIKGA